MALHPSIGSEIQKLNPEALIELFELDTTNQPNGEVFYFHAGTNQLGAAVRWNNRDYVPMPIEATGFEWKSSGTIPRPKIRVANVQGYMGRAVREMNDLIGARVTRIRTFAKYLDPENFPNGNPLADTTAEFARDVFFVNQKTTETKFQVEFELAAMLDVQGLKLPRRLIISNVCPWSYRGAECGYTGGPVADTNDLPTSDASKDACGKRLSSCKLRYPEVVNVTVPDFPTYENGMGWLVSQPDNLGLPFGGFPGAALVRY